jgi:hypothetical protein
MSIAPHDRASASKWDQPQFSLAAALAVMTVCAVFASLSRLMGYIPLVAAAYGVAVGVVVGGVIGLPFRTPWRCAAAGAAGALFSVTVAAAWWLLTVSNKMPALGLSFPVSIPVASLLEVRLVLYGTAIILLGTVPAASVAAVHDRREDEIFVRVTLTCVIAALVAGLAFCGFDVWSRGGFPRNLPFPYPIAAAIPLFMAAGAAALIGLTSAVVWVRIRSQLRAFREHRRE